MLLAVLLLHSEERMHDEVGGVPGRGECTRTSRCLIDGALVAVAAVNL